MPEKGATFISSAVVLQPSSWFPMRFPMLTAVVLGMPLIWRIDAPTIKNSIKAWRSRRDYLAFKLQSLDNLNNYTFHSPVNMIENHQKLTQSSSYGHVNLTSHNSSQQGSHSSVNITQSENGFRSSCNAFRFAHRHHRSSNMRMPHLGWISMTEDIRIPGLDDKNPIALSAGDIHKFIIQAVDETGNACCLGGDYFETNLSGDLCKSRPPLKDKDNGNGVCFSNNKVQESTCQSLSGDSGDTGILGLRRLELPMGPIS